ncbi:hypothetical protein [Oceanirhabdus seepicola]|uniref:Uncharacterized protein n=1 Tax=Oceanirhabdus seepicola TaxID=2828781 RepID=A0A9J6P9L6_9CLOT|nr:hypothetical protein [Oceanirhabdus seepicola]MCM1992788.1 hypothetical protein [Oceanirhabdus seepicola]
MKNVQFKFIGQGSTVSSESKSDILKPKSNRIFLDVGNALDYKNIIIDNHQEYSKYDSNKERPISVASICYNEKDDIEEYLQRIEEDEVEIVLHSEPDIDCIVSAFIISKYLNNEKLHKDMSIIVDCVEQIDSGRMEYKNNEIINPCFIPYALDEVLKRQNNQKNKYEEKKAQEAKEKGERTHKYDINEEVVQKGFKLIEVILKCLSKLDKKEKFLDNVDISKETDLFEEELMLLKKDYDLYLEERKNAEICYESKVKLPIKNSYENELKEVDALFWNGKSKCILHKYWARQDKTAPLGEGFIFTFILSQILKGEHQEKRIKHRDINVNRVIISVNPRSDVSLKGLGEALEKGECFKEKEYFKSRVSLWRNRGKSRFPEEWCDNDDPWYDGRNFDYTIVDSPRIGSLMSISEIKHIVNNFTAPLVEDYLIKYVIPFTIDEKKYTQLCKKLNKIKGNNLEEDEIKEYFCKPIQTYLFENSIEESNSGNRSFNCNKYSYDIKSLIRENMLNEVNGKTLNISDNILNIIVFKYGIGFIHFDIEIQNEESNLRFDEILNIKYDLSNNTIEERIFNKLIEGIKIKEYVVEKKKVMFFSGISIKSNIYYEEKHKKMIYKQMNSMNWKGVNHNSRYMNYFIDRDIIKADENTYYGFSKNGGALLIIDDNDKCENCTSDQNGESNKLKCINECGRNKNKKSIHDYFGKNDFYLFLIALQQRLSLLAFDNKLSVYDKKSQKRDIQRLRGLLVNFTTQGWFSEVTEDKIGTVLYKKWTEIFENTDLYNEIYSQLSAVDDYYKAKMSNQLTLISAITFPMVFIGSIAGLYDTGYMTSGRQVFELKWIPATEEMVGALSIGWGCFSTFSLMVFLIVIIFFYRKR